MAITVEDVQKIAALAKLKFSPQEMEKFTKQLSEIVTYIEKLNELDTSNVEPTYHVLNLTNVFREDQVKPWLTQQEATANAPKKQDGYFSVPKVINPDE